MTPTDPSAHARHFAGSVPAFYERWMVPLIFEPFAEPVARRVARRNPSRVLEIACGTGVVTRRLAELLPAATELVATDLNEPMLDQARAMGTSRPVEWRVADAMALPFPDASFDVVVCQFAAMFFPDKPKAFSEARRVLRSGGFFLFEVWDRIEENEIADAVTSALAPFLGDAKSFLARVPHAYHDPEAVARDLALGGFVRPPSIETRAERSRSAAPIDAARAYCEGTPLRSEIEARRPGGLADAVDAAAREIERRFGPGPVDAKIQAHVIEVEREL
jgi:SAM-dependent methyltransferase